MEIRQRKGNNKEINSHQKDTPNIEKHSSKTVENDSGVTKENSYWLTRAVLIRYLGFIYFVAFCCAATQLPALVGSDGILPVKLYLNDIKLYRGSEAIYDFPTIFWLRDSDNHLLAASWLGVILSLLVIFGYACSPIMFLLWALYMSIANVGQLFYGYGWEMQLLETGFLGIFFAPLFPGELNPKNPPPVPFVYLYKWLIFRIMLGAGMIKIRGDPCWHDLTCLDYHYETQPIPNPISWYLHNMPQWFQASGVMVNHIVELAVPFMIFIPIRVVKWIAGFALIGFQVLLIISGNLSFLNYLTIVPAIACFDDAFFIKFCTQKLYQKWKTAVNGHKNNKNTKKLSKYFRTAVNFSIVSLVLYLSIDPIKNLISPRQAMNRSFDRLKIVNTYGAFGSVGSERNEVIIMGTNSSDLSTAEWFEYEFKCKPGRIDRRPCVIAPFQPRIDWQIWFAAMSDYQHNPWLVHLIHKLLKGDEKTLNLLDSDEGRPFGDNLPTYIKAELYTYHFTSYPKNATLVQKLFNSEKNWWTRTWQRSYLPPLSLDHKSLQQFIQQNRWT